MKKYILLIAILISILGCADKKYIVHDPLKNELLAYTSKAQITNKDENTLIIATYLNPVYQSKINIKDEEKFLVAINPKRSIKLDTIKLNNKSDGIRVRVLKSDDKILELVGFKIPWSEYYEISTPSKNSKKLSLTFEIYPSDEVLLDFQKVSKSLYWNP